jgi:hypothetical protein
MVGIVTLAAGIGVPVSAIPGTITGATISGTPHVGSVLTAVLTPSDATAHYQWGRSRGTDGRYDSITGATSNSYTPVAADVGLYIYVEVRGVGNYYGDHISNPVGPITIPITDVRISDTPHVGNALTAVVTPLVVTPLHPITANYQWRESTTPGGIYHPISGATGNSYTPVSGDVGKYIEVLVTGTGLYNGTFEIPAEFPVTIRITGIGATTGTPKIGSTLTAGAVTPSGATVTYQWQESVSPGGPFYAIIGGTSRTYTPDSGDVGNYIEVVATGTGSYSGSVTSNLVGPVTTPITGVSISGSPYVGSLLTTVVTPSDATASYQWGKSAKSSGPFYLIAGATLANYTPGTADEGNYFEVQATGTGSYINTVWSTAAGPVLPAQTPAPTITTPIYPGATSVSGTSADSSGISLTVNGGAAQTTTADATTGAWTVIGLTPLQTGDTISVTATAPLYAVSNPATTTVVSILNVTSISPSTGPVDGGTPVTITGTGFTGVTRVHFGITAAPMYTVNSATKITAISPPAGSPGQVDVTVTTSSGTSAVGAADQFTYAGTSSSGAVTRSMPVTVRPGATITVTLTPGATFVTSPGWGVTETLPAGWTFVSTTADSYSIVGGAYQFTKLSATPITYTITAPAAPGAYPFSGTFVDGNQNTGTVGGVTSETVSVGTVTRSMPATAETGSNITITLTPGASLTTTPSWAVTETLPAGWTFVSTTADSQSVVGGAYQFTKSSATPITYTVTAPAAPGAYTFSGTFADGNGNTGTVSGATSITIVLDCLHEYDSNHDGLIEKSEAVQAVTDYLFNNTLSEADSVTIVTAYLFGTTVYWPPTVTGIQPSSGPASGTSVTITGTGFTGATMVMFGTSPTDGFNVIDANTITAPAPAGSAGTVDVTVITPGGTSATSSADQFTYTGSILS